MKRALNIPKDDFGGGWGTRGWVVSTLYAKYGAELKQKIEGYFRDFHPMGYDTHIATEPYRHKDGYWVVRIRRWSTCD